MCSHKICHLLLTHLLVKHFNDAFNSKVVIYFAEEVNVFHDADDVTADATEAGESFKHSGAERLQILRQALIVPEFGRVAHNLVSYRYDHETCIIWLQHFHAK